MVKIGVLGGIGPESTGRFYNKLINGLQKSGSINSNKDFPQIIINSIPAGELIQDRHGKEVIDEYLEGLRELDLHNPDFIVMVCNTIHFYLDYLQQGVKAPILDLREEVRNAIGKTDSYCVLGTETTIKNLYGGDLDIGRADMETIKKAIFNYNKGINKKRHSEQVRALCRKYHGLGADKIVLGCTELTLMADEDYTIDTIQVLADATISRIKNGFNKAIAR